MKGCRAGLLLAIPAALFFFMAHSSAKMPALADKAGDKDVTSQRVPPEASQWAELTLRKMSVDEKIGQLMHDVTVLQCGGFINITQSSPLGIVKSQAYPSAVLNNQLQAKSKLPLLIGADFERGTAMRLDEGTSFPTAMALAAAGNPRDAY